MAMVLAEVADEAQLAALMKAIEVVLPPSAVKVLELKQWSDQGGTESALEALAIQVVDLVKPNGKQPMREEALRAVLWGWDTLSDQQGDPDPALRNAFGAISKALRPLFKFETSPIDRLATRKKYFEAGHYMGTKYYPTALGVRVREILKSQGVL